MIEKELFPISDALEVGTRTSWVVNVYTGGESNAGTDAHVFIKLYGIGKLHHITAFVFGLAYLAVLCFATPARVIPLFFLLCCWCTGKKGASEEIPLETKTENPFEKVSMQAVRPLHRPL